MSIFTIVFAFLAFSGIIIAMQAVTADRKSTRLNSSHSQISYAVFCLKKKKNRRMFHANLRLVVSIANGYPGLAVPFLALIQESTLGLTRAVENFHWHRGYTIVLIATW